MVEVLDCCVAVFQLTDAAIVNAILNPEPEVLEEIQEESEDEIPERRYTLPEQLEASEILLRSMMEHNNFDSTDSLYFTTLINRLRRRIQKTSRQLTLTRFFRRNTA